MKYFKINLENLQEHNWHILKDMLKGALQIKFNVLYKK